MRPRTEVAESTCGDSFLFENDLADESLLLSIKSVLKFAMRLPNDLRIIDAAWRGPIKEILDLQ